MALVNEKKSMMTTKGIVAIVLLLLFETVLGQECTADGKLCDQHERCPVWKEQGECFKNAAYMNEYCPASCHGETEPDTSSGECKDYHVRCPLWEEVGECDENPSEMHRYCPKSCGVCGEASGGDELCVDGDDRCAFWASHGECDANPNYMHEHCSKSCDTCGKTKKRTSQQQQQRNLEMQLAEDDQDAVDATEDFGEIQRVSGDEAAVTLDIVRLSVDYMQKEATELPDDVLSKCLNRNELCAFWASLGECDANKAYMVTNCAPSCRTCHLIDIEARCPPIADALPALRPGTMNKMFETIVDTAPGNRTLTDEERAELSAKNMTEYTVTVHSRPSDTPVMEVSPARDRSLPPWVVTFDNFLTPHECQVLIDLGYKYGYKRSRDVGAQNFDGTFEGVESKGRTSENAWCSQHEGCRQHDVVQNVMNRMGAVMGIAPENSEDLQLLKYEVGQFYNAHHDYIPHQVERQCGPRILTFFLYLSDVEDGGGTDFPKLGIEVKPKVGRALLWPSVLNSRPMEQDHRTTHAALPVKAGTKFAANGWIHMYDYLSPQARGCN